MPHATQYGNGNGSSHTAKGCFYRPVCVDAHTSTSNASLVPYLPTVLGAHSTEWHRYLDDVYGLEWRGTITFFLNDFEWFYWDSPLDRFLRPACSWGYDLVRWNHAWTAPRKVPHPTEEVCRSSPEGHMQQLGFFVKRRRQDKRIYRHGMRLEVLRVQLPEVETWFYVAQGSGIFLAINNGSKFVQFGRQFLRTRGGERIKVSQRIFNSESTLRSELIVHHPPSALSDLPLQSVSAAKPCEVPPNASFLYCRGREVLLERRPPFQQQRCIEPKWSACKKRWNAGYHVWVNMSRRAVELADGWLGATRSRRQRHRSSFPARNARALVADPAASATVRVVPEPR